MSGSQSSNPDQALASSLQDRSQNQPGLTQQQRQSAQRAGQNLMAASRYQAHLLNNRFNRVPGPAGSIVGTNPLPAPNLVTGPSQAPPVLQPKLNVPLSGTLGPGPKVPQGGGPPVKSV